MVLVKSVCLILVFCGIVGCLLLSYSFISGDREDRADMQATVARFFENVQPNAVHEARLSSLEAQ